MSTKNLFLFIGGDERYIHAIHYLAAQNNTIYTIGYKEDTFIHPNIFPTSVDTFPVEKATHIILPVQGMSDHYEIHCELTNETILLSKKFLMGAQRQCVFFTGTANDTLRRTMKEMERKLIVIFERDDVAIYNSIPTAEGILQIALEKTNQTVHGREVCITGFGRIGMTIARLFHQVGAHVTVTTRREHDTARIKEMGLHAIAYKDLATEVTEKDMIINTVPALIFTKEIIRYMKKDVLYIDVASKPGGADFQALLESGIVSLHALGLPGKVAPKTAGEIIANIIGSYH